MATDGSSASIKAIVNAVQIAKEKNAELIALHVNIDVMFSDLDPSFHSILREKLISEKTKEALDPDTADMLKKYLDNIEKSESLTQGEAGLEIARSLGKKNEVSVKIMTIKGREADTIIKVAENESVDMIVVGSKGLTGIDKLLLGSVADKVNRLATVPVLITR